MSAACGLVAGGGSAGEPAEVSDGMARAVKEIKGAVAEVVVCGEAADSEGRLLAGRGGEVNLDEVAPGVVGFEDRGVFVSRIPWDVGFLETGANYQGRGGRESGGTSCVIPMPMTGCHQSVARDSNCLVGRWAIKVG